MASKPAERDAPPFFPRSNLKKDRRILNGSSSALSPAERLKGTNVALEQHVTDESSIEQQAAAKSLRPNSELLSTVLARYRTGLCARAFRILGNREDAEDAVQDAMLHAIEKLSMFEGRSQFSTWLTRIVINEALMRLRKRRRLPAKMTSFQTEGYEDILDLLPGAGPSPEALALQREMESRVADEVSHLPPRSREAFQLCAVEEWTVGEIARELGVNLCTAKSQCHRARKKIARRMRSFSPRARSSSSASRGHRAVAQAA
jgi:RNA polymerase sigma-70 factor, ECF subfamily